jgi:hypothetical protein
VPVEAGLTDTAFDSLPLAPGGEPQIVELSSDEVLDQIILISESTLGKGEQW